MKSRPSPLLSLSLDDVTLRYGYEYIFCLIEKMGGENEKINKNLMIEGRGMDVLGPGNSAGRCTSSSASSLLFYKPASSSSASAFDVGIPLQQPASPQLFVCAFSLPAAARCSHPLGFPIWFLIYIACRVWLVPPRPLISLPLSYRLPRPNEHEL